MGPGRLFLQDIISTWQESVPSRSAAALAYRGIFSMAPILFLAMILVAIFFGEETAKNEVALLVESTVGEEAAELIGTQIEVSAKRLGSDRTLVSLISLGVLLYASLVLFRELKIALNTIWGLPPLAKEGVFTLVKHQLVALVMLLSIGIFFVSLVLINNTVSLVDTYILPGELLSLKITGLVASFGMLVLLIALLYKFLPAVDMAWTDVLLGATVTALLTILGIWGISYYLSFSNVGSAFGAAEAAIITLLWIYYTAQVFLFGAVFTKAYATNFGSMKAGQGKRT
jgi:membrane protein